MRERTSRRSKPAPRPGGGARRWLLVLSGVLTLSLTLASAYAMTILVSANGKLDDNQDPSVEVDEEPEDPGKPINVLILGSDTREGLTPEEQERLGTEADVDGERSDTIIFAHFDPRRDRAILLHFPRDLLVEIPGYGQDKINAAYTLGGPNLTLRTVRELTGLPIHHFVEVGFVGFRDIVAALGGVRVCITGPLDSDLAGIHLPPGCHELDGDQALAFVRVRDAEGDVIPDFARISRQQQFIRAVANKVLSFGSITKLNAVVNAVADNIITDTEVSFTDLLDWAGEIRGLAEKDESGESTVDLRVVPGVPQEIDGVSYVVADPKAEVLFRRLRTRVPLGNIGTELALTDLSPAQVTVQALDGGGTENRLEKVNQKLEDSGFHVLAVAESPRPKSQIVYAGPAFRKHGEVVGEFFPGLAMAQVPAESLGDAQVAVVVGRDFDWFEAVGTDPPGEEEPAS